jgi:hypothetical protein
MTIGLARIATILLLVALIPPSAADGQVPFLGVQVDADGNRVLLVVPESRLDRDFLYLNTLATGAGVGRLGLDRGQTGTSAVVRLERRGNRVLLVRDNWTVRALGGDEAEARAAAESFPRSVVASFPIQDGDSADGRITLDATAFFLGDVYDVIGSVRRAGQGTLRLDRDRSWVDESSTGSFPNNAEIRSVLTYVTDQPGADLRRAAPDATAITLEQHHSLLALPESGDFRPRRADGRAGLFQESFLDYSQPFDGSYRGGYTARWRLVPRDPEAYLRGELVEAVQPIVYYLDPAIPEPYRSAFREGGMWWNEIFEAAGFRNAFEVRDLPAGADPMDVRYPMLYWVHRTEPGPSVGPSYRDPRTGEILSTVVRMDSHRSLVDYNIYAGLLPAAGPDGLAVSAEEFTMARRRQHAAHEIGHTLGLAHNFIAASQGRSSVMDYPFPDIDLDVAGRIDLSRAYADGGGAWDSLAVRYAYTWFPDEKAEQEGLDRIVADALQEGLRFITGGHASAAGSIPEASQWVDGSSAFESLERTTRVRRLLLDAFDERAIRPGEPMSMLNMRFAHVYLHHRYALEAAIKYVGGMEFTYAMRGDGQIPARVLPADEQRRALAAALEALEPAALAVPGRLLELIPPAPYGSDGSEIWLASAAGPAFDAVTLAGGLATEVVENLLHPQRAHRLVLFHARDGRNPSLNEVVEMLVERSWGGPPESDATHELTRRAVQRVVLNALLDLAGNPAATPEVRAAAEYHLVQLHGRLSAASGGGSEERAHRAMASRDLDRYFAGNDEPDSRSRFPVVSLPWP